MDDDAYLNGLLDKAAPADVAEYSWYECVEGFKKADRDMGSAFQKARMDEPCSRYLLC